MSDTVHCATCARGVIPGPTGRCPVCGQQVAPAPAPASKGRRLLASCALVIGLFVAAAALGGAVGLISGGLLAGAAGAVALPAALIGSVLLVEYCLDLLIVLLFPLWLIGWVVRALRGEAHTTPDMEDYPHILLVTPLTGAAGWGAGALVAGMTSPPAVALAVAGVVLGIASLLVVRWVDQA